jgi:hypothetical protein
VAVNDQSIQGYRQLQARVIALILRHDEQRFRALIDQRAGSAMDTQLFDEYRSLTALFQLHESLFDDIIPSITRRLSFASPQSLEREEMPARGRINWSRSLESTWDERPGEPPLQVYTHIPRRDFATPENLLTIITLLEVAENARHLLTHEYVESGDLSLSHPLHNIIERSERALNFPQFASLVSTAQQAQAAGQTEQIEATVAERHSFDSSAYGRLLEWRQTYEHLRLLELGEQAAKNVVGADPKRDNYLYQLWLFYELLNLFRREDRLRHYGTNSMQFVWGANDTLYELSHDQSQSTHWFAAPGVRPDYYIHRVERHEIKDGNQLIWREPGYLLDAKYYQPRESDATYNQSQKRMLADLQLLGERYGHLLYAYAPAQQKQHQLPSLYAKPEPSFNLNQHIRIEGSQIPPLYDEQELESYLHRLLDQVHASIGNPVEIKCYGVIGDSDTRNPSGLAITTCDRCGAALAFCPKPHVSPSHIDRVCPKCDCLSNIRLCHIIGQENATLPPRVERVLTQEDFNRNVEELRAWLSNTFSPSDDSEAAERARNAVIEAMGTMGVNYVKSRNTNLEPIADGLRRGTFRKYWDKDLHCLDTTSRDMLIAGDFIWFEVNQAPIPDWAACIVQYLRSFEIELYRRIYLPGASKFIVNKVGFTFGSVGAFLYNLDNRQVLIEHVLVPNKLSLDTFRELANEIQHLKDMRNKVAHKDSINKNDAIQVRNTLLGSEDSEEKGIFYRICDMLITTNK